MYHITTENHTGEFYVEDMTCFRDWNNGQRGEIKLMHETGKKLGKIAAVLAKTDSPAVKIELIDKECDDYEIVKCELAKSSAAAIAKQIEAAVLAHAIKTGNYLAHPMAKITKAEYEAQLEEQFG